MSIFQEGINRFMKIIRQIGIIFAICWFSEVIESILPFSFPASVTGMILLFICLAAGILKIEHVQEKDVYKRQYFASSSNVALPTGVFPSS